jgi:hypothetical protein
LATVRYQGKRIDASTVDGGPPPKVGDTIYVYSSFYLSHGVDDFAGGQATVSSVEVSTSGGKPVWWVSIKERPGHGYNWALLREQQTKLAAEYGNQKAHPDPDDDPASNCW